MRHLKDSALRLIISHYFSAGWFIMICLIILTFAAMISTCGVSNEEENRDCEEVNLNSKIKRLFYWGFSDPNNWTPNQGPSIGNIRFPIWIAPNRICVVTGTFIDGVSHNGIFEINFDGDSIVFQNYTYYDFPHLIESLKYDSNQETLMIIYFEENTGHKAAYVTLLSNQTVIEDEIISEDWSPSAISCWPGKPGVVFYGRNPQDSIKGFYWRYPTSIGEKVDSLLYSISLSSFASRGFSISEDGHYLFFGISSGKGISARFQFLKLDISLDAQNPIVIIDRTGEFISSCTSPTDSNLLLINYQYWGDSHNLPKGHIEVLDSDTYETIDLNIRTHKSLCRFIKSEYPSWNPSGNHFAFSAGAFDGEGATYPFELWIYTNVR